MQCELVGLLNLIPLSKMAIENKIKFTYNYFILNKITNKNQF